MVTRSSRFPLLIDPQGQAVGWITCREKERLPAAAPTVQLMDPKIKDKLEFAMQEGKAFIVLGVENEIDPMFDPVLEKEYVQKGRRCARGVLLRSCDSWPSDEAVGRFFVEFEPFQTTRSRR